MHWIIIPPFFVEGIYKLPRYIWHNGLLSILGWLLHLLGERLGGREIMFKLMR
jgi:hypothetical protein